MIALRSAMFARKSGGAWVNPYVTDGLVGYWDGEWNAGGGKHDASASTWNDVAGGIDLRLLDGKTVLWGEKYAQFQYETFNSLTDFSLNGSLSVELVMASAGASPSTGIAVFGIGDQYGYGNAMNLGFAMRHYPSGAYWSYPSVYGVRNNGIGGDPLYTWSPDGQVYYWYQYDLPTRIMSGGASAPGHSNSGFGRTISSGSASGTIRMGTDDSLQPIKLYSLRIYNRALTDEEHSHNKSVDFLRFW